MSRGFSSGNFLAFSAGAIAATLLCSLLFIDWTSLDRELDRDPGDSGRGLQLNFLELQARVAERDQEIAELQLQFGTKPSKPDGSVQVPKSASLADATLASKPSDVGISDSDVAVGVLTAGVFHKTRLQTALATWLLDVPNVLAFSDLEPDAPLGIDVVIEGYEPWPDERLYTSGARRAIPMLITLHERFPNVSWYVLADDDTYIYWPTLLRDLLLPRDPDGEHYVGHAYPTGENLEGIIPGKRQPMNAFGGAGVVLSRGLMRRLAPTLPRCRRDYTWDWPGDTRLSQCVEDLGLKVQNEDQLHLETPSFELDLEGELAGLPPASYHHVTGELAHQLHRGRMVYDQGRRVDFARLVLRPARGRPPGSSRNFRFRFGYCVEIYGGNATVADRLRSFRAAPSGSDHHFEQYFDGPKLCEDLPGHPVTALVRIRCGTCPGAESSEDEELKLCAASGPDSCTHILDVAAICPSWISNNLIGRGAGDGAVQLP